MAKFHTNPYTDHIPQVTRCGQFQVLLIRRVNSKITFIRTKLVRRVSTRSSAVIFDLSRAVPAYRDPSPMAL